MKKSIFLFLSAVMLFNSCSSDDSSSNTGNAVAFVNPSLNLTTSETAIALAFEKPTSAAGTVTLSVTPQDVVYGTDFTTTPAVTSGSITVPFDANLSSVNFTFKKLTDAFEGDMKNVVFTITAISVNGINIPEATKKIQVNFGEVPVTNATVSPAVGGPTVPNQVFFDLSSGNDTAVPRTKWDLGFYGGENFRVVINGSLKMAVKRLETTDITQIVTIDNTVAVGEGGGTGVVNGNPAYVDGPDGDITQTAISEISVNNADNKVYLLNLGYDLATTAPGVGSVNPYGAARGWKKIRIVRNGSDYKLQYANVDATTFNEVTITKNPAYNFTFFSLTTNTVVQAEPEKAKWDLSFTPFTNLTNFGTGMVSYAFQDFIVTNRNGGASAYQVLNSDGVTYANFTLTNVNTDNFNLPTSKDQRVIGSNWRNGGGPTSLPSPRDDRFYVVKDPAGNIYKIRFIAMTNSLGERGFPSFEYQRLN